TCAGLCRGECSGTMTQYYCDGPLLLPDCAVSSGCENLAAATAAIHRVCAAGSAFVSGPTPPEVGPAIADNLPALLVSDARAAGLVRAAAHLEGAAAALTPLLQSERARACTELALSRLSKSRAAIDFAVNAANSVAWQMTREPDPGAVCVANSFDDSCASCVKSTCCDALTACTQISGCFDAANCVRQCMSQGGTQASCASQCQLDTELFSTVESFIKCQDTECQASCAGPIPNGGACVASGSTTYLVDDFEDQNTAAPNGNWHITNPDGFLGSITLNQPGALDSAFALGVAGSPDPGMSIDFNGCMDARGTSALSFQATSPDATTSTVMVTLRIRTRPNELQSRGGACSGSQCGDYHLFTTTVPARAFGLKSVPWSWFLDSGAHPPDLSQILGIDFVLYGSQAQQIVIDDVKFEGPNL
ncbi:MAG TPA: hypothetical protein VFQ61_32345, partial [Polyangiaceae bacterium]|nr:hypothetical protein [Polyangiaceae bacterium]